MPGLLRFGFTVNGREVIARAISGLGAAVTDLTPAWRNVVADFYATEQQRFADEGSYEGGPTWEPLSDNPEGHGYKSWKEWHFPGQPILTLRGGLRRSLTQQGSEGNVTEVGPMALSMGTKLAVGKSRRWNLGMLHQTGTERMPARPPVWVSPQEKKRWTRFIRMTATDAVNSALIEHNLKGAEPSLMSRH